MLLQLQIDLMQLIRLLEDLEDLIVKLRLEYLIGKEERKFSRSIHVECQSREIKMDNGKNWVTLQILLMDL